MSGNYNVFFHFCSSLAGTVRQNHRGVIYRYSLQDSCWSSPVHYKPCVTPLRFVSYFFPSAFFLLFIPMFTEMENKGRQFDMLLSSWECTLCYTFFCSCLVSTRSSTDHQHLHFWFQEHISMF